MPSPPSSRARSRIISRGFFSGDMAGSEILHDGVAAIAAQGHQIAAKSDIFGSQRHSHAGGFER